MSADTSTPIIASPWSTGITGSAWGPPVRYIIASGSRPHWIEEEWRHLMAGVSTATKEETAL